MASTPNLQQSILNDLATNCLQHANNIIDRCGQFASQDYTSKQARDLIELIKKISGYLAKKVLKIRDQEATDNRFSLLNQIDSLLKDFAAHLRFAVSATTFNLPFSLVKPLERLAKQIIAETTLLIRPMWQYNYALYLPDLKKVYFACVEMLLTEEELNDCFGGFPDKYFVVSFPFIERKEILLHSILGHELGHLVADEFINTEDDKESTKIQEELTPLAGEKFDKEYAAEINETNPLFIDQIKQQYINQKIALAGDIRRRGIEELVSDLVAILIFGPASFFAFYQFAIQENMDTVPSQRVNYYPPWRMRLRLAYKYLEERKFLEYHNFIDPRFYSKIDDFFNKIKLIINETSDKDAIKESSTTQCAYNSIERTIPKAKESIEKIINNKKLIDAKELYTNFDRLLIRLENDIPPNAIELDPEKPTPVRIEKVLNAAWFYKMSKFPDMFVYDEGDDEKKAEQYHKDMDVLNRLTLKAMEWSQIQERFQQRDTK